jgi:hypothetical protein
MKSVLTLSFDGCNLLTVIAGHVKFCVVCIGNIFVLYDSFEVMSGNI